MTTAGDDTAHTPGPDPASGTQTDDGAANLAPSASSDALLAPEVPEGSEGPRHLRPPRTAGDYARALLHRLRAQAPLAVVLAVVVLGFVRIGLQHWRDGTTILGAALVLAAVLRVALPDRTAGLLAVRPRRTDVLTYALFGTVVILLSLTITGGPLAVR